MAVDRTRETALSANPKLLIGADVVLDNHDKTFNAKGDPELTMVWMDVEGDELLFNTAEGRRKPDNIRCGC